MRARWGDRISTLIEQSDRGRYSRSFPRIATTSRERRAWSMSEPLPTPCSVHFESFEFDFRSGELREDGRKVKVQGQPVQILAMLLERPGELVTRDELRNKLWPADTYVDFEHSLNAAVKR